MSRHEVRGRILHRLQLQPSDRRAAHLLAWPKRQTLSNLRHAGGRASTQRQVAALRHERRHVPGRSKPGRSLYRGRSGACAGKHRDAAETADSELLQEAERRVLRRQRQGRHSRDVALSRQKAGGELRDPVGPHARDRPQDPSGLYQELQGPETAQRRLRGASDGGAFRHHQELGELLRFCPLFPRWA